MSSIRPFIAEPAEFQPELVSAMGKAFDETCSALQITAEQTRECEAVAERIMDLARAGVRDPKEMLDQMLESFRGE